MPISDYKNYDGVINVLDKRIDTIIATPVGGVSAQEMYEARQGAATLGKNLDGIRQDLNKTLSIRIAFGDEPPEDSLIWFDTSDK